MNWLDFVLGVILFSTAFAGFRRGFSRSVVGMAATVLALVLSLWFYGAAGQIFIGLVSSAAVANFLGFMAIFAGISILGAIVGWALSKTLKTIGLGWLDGILGAGLGALRGAVISIGIILMIGAFSKNPPPDSVKNSAIAPYVMGVADVISYLAPREFRDGFAKTYEKVKEIWSASKKGSV